MSYTHALHIPNGLALDFTVEAADTANDAFLGYNSSGEITSFTSIPRSRVSGGGNVSESTSSVLTITGGTSAILTSGLTIQVKQASTSQSGYISSSDWNTFNNKIGSGLNSAQIYVGNASNIATAVNVTGDVLISNAGVMSISSGVIVNADINNSAGIAVTKLAALTPTLMMATNGSGFATTVAGFTPTIGGYMVNVTSDVQAQLNSKLSVTLSGVASGDFITYNGTNWVNIPTPASNIPTGGGTHDYLRKINGTNYNTEWHTFVTADVTDISATFTEINILSGVSTSTAQLNYSNTLSGPIQAQIDSKLSIALAQNNMLYGNASNLATTLAPGANGYLLTSVSGVPTWVAPGVGGGTVTSVNASGGTTGLSFSGGPITTSGSVTLSGTLVVANGGTGITTLGSANTILGVNNAGTANEHKVVSNGLTSAAVSLKIGGQLTDASTSVYISYDTITEQDFSIKTYTSGSPGNYAGIQIQTNFGAHSLQLIGTDGGSNIGTVQAGNNGSININSINPSAQGVAMDFSAGGASLIMTDTRASKSGIQYAAAGYVTSARSLTDRDYVLNSTFTFTNKTLGSGTKIILGSDATGDIYYNGGSGTTARLAAGTAGYKLTSGGPGVAPLWILPDVYHFTYNTSTTGNTDSTILPLIISGQTIEYVVTLVWRNTSTGASASTTIRGIFKNIGGTVTQEGSTQVTQVAYGDPTLVAASSPSFVISGGTDVRVRTVGIAATNITWGLSATATTNN